MSDTEVMDNPCLSWGPVMFPVTTGRAGILLHHEEKAGCMESAPFPISLSHEPSRKRRHGRTLWPQEYIKGRKNRAA